MSNDQISRRNVLKLFGTSSLGLALSTTIGYAYSFCVEPHWLEVKKTIVPLRSLAPGFTRYKLVCLSDFHHEPGDGLVYLGRVVRRTNQLQPDLICLLGDYVYSDANSIHELANELANLEAPDGVYAVLGNHDYWTDPMIVAAGLRQAGIKVLINEGVVLERSGQSIYLAGLDDGWSGDPDPEQTLISAPDDAPVIMLMHEPDFAEELSEYGQIDLQLSGHSHGGQVKPLFFEAPMRPAYGRDYTAGLYRVSQMQLYVTRGIGTIPPRARFNCRPEITQITLTDVNLL